PEADVMTTPINVAFASMEVPGYQPQLVITRKPPTLAISSTPTTITLRWPVAAGAGWTLQRSGDLASAWTNHTAPLSNVDGHWQLQIPVATREFFRLIRN